MVNLLFYHIANQRHVSSHTKIFIFLVFLVASKLARYQNRLTHPANERVVYHRARGGRVIWVLSSGANTDPSSATSSSPSPPFTSSSSSSSPHPRSSANQPSPARIFTHTSRSLLILGDFSNIYTCMFNKHRLSITSEIIDGRQYALSNCPVTLSNCDIGCYCMI